MPTPSAADGTGGPGTSPKRKGGDEPPYRSDATTSVTLLPTPTARDYKSGASNLIGRNSRPLNEIAVNLLPTPKASDGPNGGPNQRDAGGRYYLPGLSVRLDTRWIAVEGTDFGPAIRRWESITGTPAPCPTEPGARGNRRLSPLFVEWMLGLPAGHVTAVPDVKRSAQIRVLGGGVVPQQAVAALRSLGFGESEPMAVAA